MLRSTIITLTLCLLAVQLNAQSLTELAETLETRSRSVIKQRAYEFLRTWNPSADLAKPLEVELSAKILKNKQKRKLYSAQAVIDALM